MQSESLGLRPTWKGVLIFIVASIVIGCVVKCYRDKRDAFPEAISLPDYGGKLEEITAGGEPLKTDGDALMLGKFAGTTGDLELEISLDGYQPKSVKLTPESTSLPSLGAFVANVSQPDMVRNPIPDPIMKVPDPAVIDPIPLAPDPTSVPDAIVEEPSVPKPDKKKRAQGGGGGLHTGDPRRGSSSRIPANPPPPPTPPPTNLRLPPKRRSAPPYD